MSRQTFFVEIILPVPLPQTFTYRVPNELNDYVERGKRVVVTFGKSKTYTGVIEAIHETPPKTYKSKYIEAVLDEVPVVLDHQFKLWEWMAHYYMCAIGEVMNAALPAGLKLDSEQKLMKHPDFENDFNILTDKEYLVVEALSMQEKISIQDVKDILGIKTVQPIIRDLIKKGAVIVEDELRAKYKPKIQKYIRLPKELHGDAMLNQVLDGLQASSRNVKQLQLFMAYLHLSEHGKLENVTKRALLDFSESSVSPLNTLVKKGLLLEVEEEQNRIAKYEDEQSDFKALSESQETALGQIKAGIDSGKPVLLHGVTSSGKTEVYVELINETIVKGKQVLFMIPEIALTTQLIQRLQRYFGDRVGIFHSRFGQNERVEVWKRTMTDAHDKFDILVGARSSLFLPFRDLGLIIVDEEHESSFKQFDPAPRYHGRDTAVMLSHLHDCPIVLGSATPSIESYWQAEEGKYALVKMNKRFGSVKMPEILCADLKKEQREKTMQSHFSSFLLKNLEEAIANKEQAILFQNRRGYTPMWVCEDCGWVPQCTRCDVSLTYHKLAHLLNCHYCGYAIHPPQKCGSCNSTKLQMKGFGTEKIEDELKLLYPNLRIARMDWDTTRSKHAYQNIIESFSNRELDVLIGTQMVSKGLDFDHVSLVGVLNADQMLNFPDFRSFERAYQLMSQVAGRAGRKQKRGKVVIQTYQPDHWIIQQVMNHDFETMYKQEVFERKNYSYPPFFRLIQFTIKHKNKDIVRACADHLAESLKNTFKNRVLGPQDPIVARINNYYLKQITLKVERDLSAKKLRDIIGEIVLNVNGVKEFKSARIVIDVDPA